MAHANALKAVVMRIEWAAFQRWMYRRQSQGNASEDQRVKRRLSGALTATVIPIVAKDSKHPSASSHIADERHDVMAAIDAGTGKSIKIGRNLPSLRISS
jgi:hypothetical protein